MKVYCPRCQYKIDIGSESRFNGEQCPNCKVIFHLLEAHVPLMNIFTLNLGAEKTPCPECWSIIYLTYDTNNGVWRGPNRCPHCTEELLNWSRHWWEQKQPAWTKK